MIGYDLFNDLKKNKGRIFKWLEKYQFLIPEQKNLKPVPGESFKVLFGNLLYKRRNPFLKQKSKVELPLLIEFTKRQL